MTLIERVNAAVLPGLLGYLQSWLPDGKLEGNEFVARNPRRADSRHGSFKVNVRSGAFKDFATSDRGGNDPVALYAFIRGLGMGEAAKELATQLGLEKTRSGHIAPAPPKPQRESSSWNIVAPFDFLTVPKIHLSPKKWVYKSLDGAPIGVIERFDKPDGSKEFRPWTLWRNAESGELSWKRKIWPEPRPLYGLELLGAHPSGAVLLVEGEKAADAARRLLPSAIGVTWPGGANAIEKIDWAPLAGHKVWIWPDNDEAGVKAANLIASKLSAICPVVNIVDPPAMAAKGWDLADAEAEGWTAELVRRHIRATEKPANFGSAENLSVANASGPEAAEAPEPAKSGSGAEPPAIPKTSTIIPLFEGPPLDDPSDPGPPEPIPTTQRYAKMLGFPDQGKNGPRATIANLAYLLEQIGVVARYNVISKEEEILIPGGKFSIDNQANASLAFVFSEAQRVGLPTSNLTDYLTNIADANPYNPVAEWVTSKPWDGRPRLPDLCATVIAKGEAEEPKARELKDILIRRWLVSAIAAAFNPNGVSAHGVLVFQGEQYIGKTHWFKRLVPSSLGVILDGMMLDPKDKDSVKQSVSRWLVELGELDATFRKADIAQLKSFLTKDKDVLRQPYARKSSEFARRTVFFASVNPKEFLHDNTGNRRFWTIECESINHRHEVDMQQLWAEVLALYRSGEPWMLSNNELMLLNEHNSNFEARDPIEERIISELNWGVSPAAYDWKTSTEILSLLGNEKPTQGDIRKASQLVYKMNGGKRKKMHGIMKLLCPPRVIRPASF